MKYLLTIILIAYINLSFSQNINWSSINAQQKNLTYLNIGYDFGLTTQIGIGHKFDGLKSVLFTADYSFPMGKDLVDDFKVRIGGQMKICEKGNFNLSVQLYGVFRRHQTTLVRMASFGSEMAFVIGYYKPTWHLAGEFGFDKSISTHLKNSKKLRENYPDITDGWFVPTGGNFFYGIQGSKSINSKIEISINAGLTKAQLRDENALLPYYAQLGLNYSFLKKK